MIAPWRGELEWFPVSNPALCRVVDMREDGRSQRLFRGRLVYFSWLPPGAPIWGFTVHAAARARRPAPELHTAYRVLGPAALSFIRFSLSSLSACVSWQACIVLYCIPFMALLLTVRVVCINMNPPCSQSSRERLATSLPISAISREHTSRPSGPCG